MQIVGFPMRRLIYSNQLIPIFEMKCDLPFNGNSKEEYSFHELKMYIFRTKSELKCKKTWGCKKQDKLFDVINFIYHFTSLLTTLQTKQTKTILKSGLCRTLSEPKVLVFSSTGSYKSEQNA